MKWFLPSWHGDHRLESVKDGCRLTVVSPTPNERLLLERFLKKLVKEGILESAEVPETELLIPASIGKVAPLLVKEARPKKTTITAVRYENGRLEIVEGTDKAVVDLGERIDAAEKGEAVIEGGKGGGAGDPSVSGGLVRAEIQKVEAEKVEEKKPEEPKKDPGLVAKVAASVKRHTPSCPQCEPGSVAPASEVLLEFLSPAQHESWAKDRVIEVEGHLSGHRYLISHRNGKRAVKWGRIAFDDDDQAVLHFHDWSVPPEEEVLAAMLILGSREPWLRNEATCFQGGFTDVFKNPFGNVADGLEDAALTRVIGEYAKIAARFLGIS